MIKTKSEKVFTLGTIVSLIIGILLAAYFIWAYPKFDNNPSIEEYSVSFNKLFMAYLFGIATSFIGINSNSKKYYEKNHFWRALLYAPASFLSWTLYSAEVSDKLYQESNHENEKFWQRRNAWYGVSALLIFILVLIFIFWYAIKFYGVEIF